MINLPAVYSQRLATSGLLVSHNFLSQVIPSGNMSQNLSQKISLHGTSGLEIKIVHSKIKLSHGFILFQREWKSFLHNSTMQRNEKNISKTKLKRFLCR